MGFLDRFRRRAPEARMERRIEFLGEQDGPPERELKASIVEELTRVPAISRAYLARVGYQPQGRPAVALCLAGTLRDDPALVKRISDRFGAMFGQGAALDIVFLTREQEADVARVCGAFYPPDSSAQARVAEGGGAAASEESCTQCGHALGKHRMHPKVYPYPTEGWMTCPVRGCRCHSTWSVEEHARPVFEAYREEFFTRVAEGGPLPEGVGMELWYYRLRDEQWRKEDESSKGRPNWLRELDALYLFGTLGTEAILRGNGAVWVRIDDGCEDEVSGVNDWRPAEEGERRSSLVIASKRMPDVRSLLPSRPTDAIDCARCSGTGWFLDMVICPDCDGLGWIAGSST
jgi:hypothetical protein